MKDDNKIALLKSATRSLVFLGLASVLGYSVITNGGNELILGGFISVISTCSIFYFKRDE